MTEPPLRRLVIGYGNPIRRDDGLGPALARRIEERSLPGVTVMVDYQLVVEIAHDIAAHDEVLFIDAATSGNAPFVFTAVTERPDEGMISHGLTPEGALSLAGTLFGATTKGWLLAVRGYDFAPFDESLTDAASANLEAASVHAFRWLSERGEEV